MTNVEDCNHELSESGLKSRFYVHFQINTIEKSNMNPCITPPQLYVK